jgi:outer membrane receptor protein involved in Fe transport
VNPQAGLEPNEQFVDPETVDNYELGIKSLWLDNRLTVNASVFYMDWEDIQLDGTADNGVGITVNGGSAETKGVELESSFALNDNWVFSAGYAYTEAELTDSCRTPADFANKGCPISGVVTEDGDRLPGSPEHQGTLQVDYFRPLNSTYDFFANWRLTTQSDVLTKLGDGDDCCRDNGEELGGFTIHYATAGISTETWDATLFIDNVFDKFAVTGVRDDRSVIGTDTDLYGAGGDVAVRRYWNNVITPRVVGVDFRYRFRGQ